MGSPAAICLDEKVYVAVLPPPPTSADRFDLSAAFAGHVVGGFVALVLPVGFVGGVVQMLAPLWLGEAGYSAQLTLAGWSLGAVAGPPVAGASRGRAVSASASCAG